MKARDFTLLAILAVGAAGCGNGRDLAPGPFPATLPATLQAAVVGTLSGNVEWEKEQTNLTPCDRAEVDLRLQIAEELDRRLPEIQAFSRTQKAALDNRPSIQLGPLRMVVQAPGLRSYVGWHDTVASWRSLFARYESIKHLPTNDAWQQLYTDFSFLVYDNSARLQGHIRPGVDKENGPHLKRIASILRTCLADPNCLRPGFGSLERNTLETTLTYVKELPTPGDDPAIMRAHLVNLLKELDRDLRWYRIDLQPGVRRVAPDLYEVTLAAGPFAGAEAQLSALIERIWQGGPRGEKIKVRWSRLPTERFKGFTLAVGAEGGARSYVDYEKRQVVLYDRLESRSIPHEFGHVLGFYDRYFKTYNETTCSYIVESDDRNIMSDLTGYVTEELWRELDEAYPFQGTQTAR